jgi:hypothetical protein
VDYPSFVARIAEAFPKGTVLKNPGRGTTKIISDPGSVLTFRRANSRFRVHISDLHRAYLTFKGKRVSTANLKAFAPEVFNTKENGHDCNCTTLFLLLNGMGLSTSIMGRGVRGDPFWVTMKE